MIIRPESALEYEMSIIPPRGCPYEILHKRLKNLQDLWFVARTGWAGGSMVGDPNRDAAWPVADAEAASKRFG